MKCLRNIVHAIRGSALTLVLLVLVVSFIIVGGMIGITVSENLQSMYQNDEIKAYYVARAGAEAMVLKMYGMDKTLLTEFNTARTATPSAPILDGTGEVEVTVERVPSGGDTFEIHATGEFEGHEEDVGIVMRYGEIFEADFGILAKDDVKKKATGSPVIQNGTYDTDIAAGGTVYIDPSKVSEGYKVVSGWTEMPTINVLNPSNIEDDLRDLDLTSIISGGPGDLLYDQYFNGSEELMLDKSSRIFNVPSGGGHSPIKGLLIDTGTGADHEKVFADILDTEFRLDQRSTSADDWMVVYIDDDFEVDGDIEVTGDGNLMIVVEDTFEILEDFKIERSDDVNVEMYILGDGSSNTWDFTVSRPQVREMGVLPQGSHPAEPQRLRIFVQGSGNAVDFGNNADVSAMFFAENGVFDFKNGNSELYGSIFAENVYANGGPDIYHKPPTDENISIGRRMTLDYWEE